jgi:integrase
MKLSQATFKTPSLPSGVKDKIFFDDDLPGFGLRIREGGKRSWVVQFRVGRKQRRMTLGTMKTLDGGEARKRARTAISKVHLGHDPQSEKMAARAPKPLEMTLGDLVERYLPYAERKLKASTYSGIVLHLRKHWQPLHGLEVRNLERRHVAAEVNRIATTSGLYGANRSRAALSALFAWAIGEGLTDANPVVGTNKATEETARDRVLTGNELRLIWRYAGEADYGAILHLLILTGQRREEVGGMLWSEIDLDKHVWRIDAERTKNGLAHDVPLSSAAVEILRKRQRSGRALVFGSREGPFQGWSNAKSALDRRVLTKLGETSADGALMPWRLHDIRRTVATRMADLGVQPHVIEAVLNHISGHKGGVAGIYNRATYAAEKRQALDLWGAHVADLAEGRESNIVPLRGTR